MAKLGKKARTGVAKLGRKARTGVSKLGRKARTGVATLVTGRRLLAKSNSAPSNFSTTPIDLTAKAVGVTCATLICA